MLTSTRNLWIERAAWQYWQLIRVLLFNFKILGYLSVFFLFITCICLLMGVVIHPFKMLGGTLAAVAFFLVVFIGVMILPVNMLAVVSNKHVFTMDGVRKKLFVIAMVFSSLPCALTYYFYLSLSEQLLSLNTVFSIFAISSLCFWLSTYLGYKQIHLIFFTPIAVLISSKAVFGFISVFHPAAILGLTLFLWALFYQWWIGFNPTSRHIQSVLFESNPRKLQELPIEKWFYFSSNQVNRPFVSLLLGYGDGYLNLGKKFLLIYCIAFSFSLFACGGLKDWHFTEDTFLSVLIALAYGFVISGIDFLSQRILLGVRRCWLVFPGNRENFFFYIEGYFWRGLRVLVLLNATIMIALLFLSEKESYSIYCFSSLTIFSILLSGSFYLNIYFYNRNKLISGEVNFYKVIVNFMFFAPLIYYVIFKYQKFNNFEVVDGIVIGVVVALIVILKIIRNKCIKKWRQADF